MASEISQYAGKTIVVKAGGDVLESPSSTIVEDAGIVHSAGARVVFVYGAQNELTERMKEKGMEPKFVNGRRVSDADFMEYVFLPVVEEQGKRLLDSLPGELILDGVVAYRTRDEAQRYRSYSAPGNGDVYGYVGNAEGLRGKVISALDDGKIAILPPMAVSDKGYKGFLNCNADDVACQAAVSTQADGLYLATTVDGIMDRNSQCIGRVGYGRLQQMIRGRFVEAEGGMGPKAECAISAVEHGVGRAYIFNGTVPHNLMNALYEKTGTCVYDLRKA